MNATNAVNLSLKPNLNMEIERWNENFFICASCSLAIVVVIKFFELALRIIHALQTISFQKFLLNGKWVSAKHAILLITLPWIGSGFHGSEPIIPIDFAIFNDEIAIKVSFCLIYTNYNESISLAVIWLTFKFNGMPCYKNVVLVVSDGMHPILKSIFSTPLLRAIAVVAIKIQGNPN